MKKYLLLFISVAAITFSYAQKKVVPVTQSTLTGMDLPNGSKKDSRLLSISVAKLLLEIESKKVAATLSSTEVLTLPAVSSSGFNADSLIKNLTDLGWSITPSEKDEKFAWLQKDNRTVITYFSMDKKETSLYFAESSVTPNLNTQEINTANTQPAATQNDQQQPVSTPVQNNEGGQHQPPGQAISNTGFFFGTTNFDDGWTSTVQEDWVLTVKADIKILIHYPNAKADAYNSVLKDGDYTAWNVLVAPRYSNMQNFEWRSIQSWESITFIEADAVENSTGKSVHIVMFKKHYSNGSGGWLEFITSTKADYENEFGAYHQTSYGWEKTADMQFRNKFAVAATDLNGTWSNNFSGMTQYVNAYTGASAGADTHASAQNFVFGSGNTYKWDIAVASGFVGNIKFQSVKSNGKFSLPNAWQVYFSDLEGKPKTYDAYFSCVKGSRLLWLRDVTYGGYSAYGKSQ